MKKLALIELQQETNSFSSLNTTRREFENFALYTGEEVWVGAEKWKMQPYGFRKAVERYGKGEFEILPIYSAWSWSGGPVLREVYEDFKRQAVEALRGAGDVVGIYCSLHGAMGVVGLRDPESDFLRAIREVVGDKMPIGVTYDLHANVTEENIRLATFLSGYHTNPHRDHKSVGYKAGKMLVDAVRGTTKPVMAFRKLRLLKGGGWGIDFLPPMRGIVQQMKRLEKKPGILSASSFWVHIWMNDPELGWSVVVTADGDRDLAERHAEELAEAIWAVRKRKHPTPKQVEEAIEISRNSKMRRMFGTTVWCDVSDVVGAGAPGGNTNILKALLENAPDLKSYVPVRDPDAAVAAFEARIGQRIRVEVGGRIDPHFNPVVDLSGEVIFRQETSWGKTVILKEGGVHLALTEMAFPAYFPGDYKQLDLNLWKADVAIVKNLFPFRFKFARYNRRTINVVSTGTTNINVNELPYEGIPRPIYPLDDIDDWRM